LEEAAKARASLTTPSKEPAGAVAVPLVAIHLIEDAAQAHDQCRAVVHMALSLAEVYAARAVILSSSANAPIEIIGESSAATMEYLGDLLSSMDAVEEGDAWLDPIFEAAHARWPLAAPGAAIDAREQEAADAGPSSKESWWAGARAGLGLPADTPRTVVAQRLAAKRPEAPPASAPAAEVAQPVAAWYLLTNSAEKMNPQHGAPSAAARAHAERNGYRIVELFEALASSPSSAPAESGWQWAPKEPTEDMLFAAEMSKARGFRELYMAMLANAPQAVQAGGEGGRG
jgi:hypothetical protein